MYKDGVVDVGAFTVGELDSMVLTCKRLMRAIRDGRKYDVIKYNQKLMSLIEAKYG